MTKKLLTDAHSASMLPSNDNAVSVADFTDSVLSLVNGTTVTTEGRRFYGRIIVCFKDGKCTFVEKHETLVPQSS